MWPTPAELEPWHARSLPKAGSRFIVLVLGALPLIAGIQLFDAGVSLPGLALFAVVSACALVAAYVFWRRMGQMSTVSLEGGALTLVQSGRTRRHLLSEGSLHAAPWTARGYGNQGTVVFVRFDDGQVVTLAFEALLPDDRYAPDMASRADLYLDPPRAQALLDRLRPYIMPRDLDGVVTDSSYSILLHPRSKLGLPTQASRCLYVVGNTVALGEGSSRDLLARAEASDVETHAYVFEPRSPIPSCPCLRLRFPREDISIVVGASPMDPLARDWWGRAVPDGDSPTYLIGEVELVRLADTLGLSRGS